MTRSPGDGEEERRKRSVCGRGDQQQTRPKGTFRGGGDLQIGVSVIGPVGGDQVISLAGTARTTL